jgi:hypothetical protein
MISKIEFIFQTIADRFTANRSLANRALADRFF